MKITFRMCHRLHSSLAQPCVLLALGAVLYGNAAHASLEPVLEARMAVCTGHLESVEKLMISRIQHIENSVGGEIRRLPELEAARGRLERQLQQERQRYQSLPWRPEHDQALRGISNEIAAINTALPSAARPSARSQQSSRCWPRHAKPGRALPTTLTISCLPATTALETQPIRANAKPMPLPCLSRLLKPT